MDHDGTDDEICLLPWMATIQIPFQLVTEREKLDPEDVRKIQRLYFPAMRGEIERYDGVVEKYAGDAVLALFGVPSAHGDDAERAVLCGLSMMQAMQDRITLHPLHTEVSISHSAALLGGSRLTEELAGHLVERAGGNRFFIEELLRALRESEGSGSGRGK